MNYYLILKGEIIMTRLEALEAMKQGHKIIHRYFAPDEYLYMVDDNIKSEEGYDFDDWFEDGTDWKENSWSVY